LSDLDRPDFLTRARKERLCPRGQTPSDYDAELLGVVNIDSRDGTSAGNL